MIKVSVFYPNRPGAKFDMQYYCDKHVPMVRQKLGGACKQLAVEHGIAGIPAGTPVVYVAMGHLYFDSIEAFQVAFGPHAQEIRADIANYTDIEPTIQISEVRI